MALPQQNGNNKKTPTWSDNAIELYLKVSCAFFIIPTKIQRKTYFPLIEYIHIYHSLVRHANQIYYLCLLQLKQKMKEETIIHPPFMALHTLEKLQMRMTSMTPTIMQFSIHLFYQPEITKLLYNIYFITKLYISICELYAFPKLQTQIVNQKICNLTYQVHIHSTTLQSLFFVLLFLLKRKLILTS